MEITILIIAISLFFALVVAFRLYKVFKSNKETMQDNFSQSVDNEITLVSTVEQQSELKEVLEPVVAATVTDVPLVKDATAELAKPKTPKNASTTRKKSTKSKKS